MEAEFNHEKLRADLITKRVIVNCQNLRDCSKEIGISTSTLSRAENCRPIDVWTLAQILKWLKTDANSYFIIPNNQ